MTTLRNEYRLVSSEILNKWFNQYIIFRNTEQMVQPIHYLQKYWTNGSTNTLPSEILNKWFNQYIIFRNTDQMVQQIHYLQKYWTNGSTNTLPSEILNKWFNQYITFRNTEQMVQPIHYLQKYWTNGSTNTLSSGTPNICISLKWSKYMTHHWHMYSVWWLHTGWGLWCLTPLSKKFELYRAGLLYSRRNPAYM